ncbi:MAG: hypothetical protein JW904_02830 [Spirochaetales bacterium]|nr:hypothetical protein [Spirochaetales bacterium]
MRNMMAVVLVFFVLAGGISCATEKVVSMPDETTSAQRNPLQINGPAAPGTAEEKKFIKDYIESMRFMVYIDEKAKVSDSEEYLYRKAVAFANDYLAKKNIEVVLLDQIESLRRDHSTLMEDVQGENLSVVQWLAQKLNADVYIVIDLLVQNEKRGNQYYAQSNVSLTAFEASTGRLLASKSHNQIDKSVGSSEQIAKTNSVGICIQRIMGDLLTTTKTYMEKAIEDGIRYEMYITDTADAKTLLKFIGAIKDEKQKVTRIESVYRTDEEGKYYVYMFGNPDEFELFIYSIAETIPGLEGIKLVSQRGKSFTFSTGM